jgi:hypothetical protein
VSISVGSNNAAALSYAGNAYGTGSPASKSTSATADNTDTSSAPSTATSVTLSDEAKAYLAQTTVAADGPLPLATVTASARAWFDQQYASLGISSAMLDGQVAVDLSGQTRATLSAMANNAQGQFTKDEVAAAAKTLQARFDGTSAPHVVIARHTGDYASLYAAASDYLDQAGADEKATPAWQDQKQAVLEGLATAKASFGKAPVTGNADDPVRSLLGRTSVQAPAAAGSSTGALATNARAMLDAQASSARDNGTELVFNSARKVGQQVDFTAFDNRSLAIVALNGDASFSAEEASAAKVELSQRTRSGLLNAFNPNTGGAKASTVALLQQYSTMSAEEKQVLGFTDDFANKVMQNYRTMSSMQNSLGSTTGMAAYL